MERCWLGRGCVELMVGGRRSQGTGHGPHGKEHEGCRNAHT